MSFSKTSWKLPYTVLTYIILMNLLIAMMADTFSSVASNAEAEYQMQFARIVKEQVETTVLCVPLNVPGEWHSSSLRRIRGLKERLQSTSSTGSPETEDGAQTAADPATRCSGVRHSPPLIARRTRDSSVPHSQGGTTHGLHRSFHSS